MTVHDAENAMRVEAQTWAQANGLAFAWDNGSARNPHAQQTLAWSFDKDAPRRLTSCDLRRSGTARARIFVPAGDGALLALQRAESLQSLFQGRLFAGAVVERPVAIRTIGRDRSSYVVDVLIPWDYDEKRIPIGFVGIHETPGAVLAYQAWRQRYEALVRAPLGLRTLFDSPPPDDELPGTPWAFAAFKLLDPFNIERDTIRTPGRVIVALNHELATGVQAAEAAASVIERAFDQVTFRGVVFGTPEVSRVGRTLAETWQTNVRLPFHFDVRT